MDIIDSHAHLTADELYFELDDIMKRCEEKGVSKVVNICTEKKSLERGLLARKRFSNLYNVGATTPHDVETLGETEFDLFAQAAKNGDLVAIGETGLDYYYEHSDKKLQQAFMVRYFHLALECNLPVVIHCRDAFDDLFDIADQEFKSEKLLLHCFTGELKDAKRAIERGWLISFSGIVTFKKSEALRTVAKEVLLEHMVIETDAPYLAPQSRRGVRCEPSFITETVDTIANVKGIESEKLAQATRENCVRFFGLK